MMPIVYARSCSGDRGGEATAFLDVEEGFESVARTTPTVTMTIDNFESQLRVNQTLAIVGLTICIPLYFFLEKRYPNSIETARPGVTALAKI